MGAGDPVTRLLVLAALAILTGTIVAAALRYMLRPDDLEALIDATRETTPDHVPDAWREEFLQ